MAGDVDSLRSRSSSSANGNPSACLTPNRYHLRGRIMHRVTSKVIMKKWIRRFFLLSDRTLILCKDERAYSVTSRKAKRKLKHKSDSGGSEGDMSTTVQYEEDSCSLLVMPRGEALDNAEARALGSQVIELRPYMKCTEIYAVKNNASRSSGMPSPWASGVGLNTSSRASEAWQFKVVRVWGKFRASLCLAIRAEKRVKI